MDSHVVLALKYLERNNISLLVLVKILSEHVGPLSVCLTPFVSLNIE